MRPMKLGDAVFMVGLAGMPEGPCGDQQGGPARNDDRQRDTDDSAHLNVFFVPAAHAEINAGGTRCREEPDNER